MKPSVITTSAIGLLVAAAALGQVLEIHRLQDLPRDAEIEDFSKRFADQEIPVDSGTLFNEIRRLQMLQQRLDELRKQEIQEIPLIRQRIGDFFRPIVDSIDDDSSFCQDTSSATDVRSWWDELSQELVAWLSQAEGVIGETFDKINVSAPAVDPSEDCESYRVKLKTMVSTLQGGVKDRLDQIAKVGREKLENIPEISRVYQDRLEVLKSELQLARKRGEEQRATSITEKLWLIFLVLGAIAAGTLLIVRTFPEKSQLELVQSGQVIQFITVLLLLTVIMALGLSGIIQENTLGTLLGGLAGYVLSQGVGRAAEHVAKKVHSQ